MSEQTKHFYEFGVFRIDAEKRVLLRDGEPVKLTPKVFDTLLVLVENSGSTLGKEELMKLLWPDSFVEESNLTENISNLREVLGERPRENRYITTVPKVGYKFVADVRKFSDEEADLIVSERTRSRITIRESEEEAVQDLVRERSAAVLEDESQPVETKLVKIEKALQPAENAGNGVKLHRSAVFWAAVAAILGLVIFGVYKFAARRSPPPFEKIRLTKLTTTGKIITAAVSPDGKNFAYVTAEAGQQSIWLRQLSTSSNSVQIVQPAEFDYHGLTFSRDGSYIYYVRSEKFVPSALYRVPTLGGASVKLAEDVDGPATLSPDEKQLAFVRGYPDSHETAMMIENTDGTGEHRLVSVKGPTDTLMPNTGPSWSPDGKVIACPVRTIDASGEQRQSVSAIALEDGKMKPLTSKSWSQVGRVSWAADGKGLVLTAADQDSALSQQVWYVSYPEGLARQLTNDLSNYRDATLAADAQTIVTVQTDQQSNIWVVPGADATRAVQITYGNYDGVNGLSWTPDGKIIYTTRAGNGQNLSVIERDGGNPVELTASEGINRAPDVSRDGRYVVFVSMRTGTEHIWRVDRDGGHPKQLTNGPGENSPGCSPDGRWVVYISRVMGGATLSKISIDGGESVPLLDKISSRPSVSPDGKWIACLYREQPLSAYKLSLLPFEGGQPVKSFNEPVELSAIRWTVDGRALLYAHTQGGISNIWSQPLDGNAPVQLTDFKQGRIFWFDLSPDGSQLAVARGSIISDVVMISNLK
ncbi:MAG: hypothetical protein DMF68_05370 [Acidobacteria bacterium]|nr:MAG: hypothetical protein DMF68_05370 [Acidobacteriota bacterium]